MLKIYKIRNKRNSVVLFISCCVFYACSGSSNAVTPAAMNAPDSTNIKIVLDLFSYFNKHDWQNYAALYADSAKFLDPSFGTTEITQTRQQTIQKYTELQKQIPDIMDEVKSVYAAGDNIITVEFVSHGSLPDKTSLNLPICTVFKMENGKIISDHTYFDN